MAGTKRFERLTPESESGALPIKLCPYMVSKAGLEPARISALDFESSVATNYTTRTNNFLNIFSMAQWVGFEPTEARTSSVFETDTFDHSVTTANIY